jgi:hypothetical protein
MVNDSKDEIDEPTNQSQSSKYADDASDWTWFHVHGDVDEKDRDENPNEKHISTPA